MTRGTRYGGPNRLEFEMLSTDFGRVGGRQPAVSTDSLLGCDAAKSALDRRQHHPHRPGAVLVIGWIALRRLSGPVVLFREGRLAELREELIQAI